MDNPHKEPPPATIYQQTPSTVVVVQQTGCCDNNDYTVKKALVPGIVIILCAVADLAVYFAIGIKYHQWYHNIYTSGFVNFLVLGALACAAANQSNRGLVIATHVWCAIVYIQSLTQFSLTLNDLLTTGLFFYTYFDYPDVIAIDAIYAIVAVIVLVCAIFIQVFCSKVTCCQQPQTVQQPVQRVPMTSQQVYPAVGQPMVLQPPQYGMQQPTYTYQTNYGFSGNSVPPPSYSTSQQ